MPGDRQCAGPQRLEFVGGGPLRTNTMGAGVGLRAFPADPDFPQLEVASDPARMLEIFRAHLNPIDGNRLRILDCTPIRFRCRQSTSRCVLQYSLRLEDPATGRRWDQWVTGLIFAAHGEAKRLCQALRATDPVREIPEPWRTFEPVSAVPELDMLIEVYPYDRRLPQLSRVLDWASRDLGPLVLPSLGPGRWQVGAATIEASRYRTELGAVLRCALTAREAETGRCETRRCYVKVYRNERGGETFELLQSWSQRAPREYSVVRPLAYRSDLRTLVLEEAPGTSLQSLLLRDGDPVDAVRAVARAVAALNQDDIGITHAHTLEEQLGQVKRASALVQWACPHLEAEVRAITGAVVAGLEEVPLAPFHGDLKADHVFLSDGRVIFVDLDSVALGDPVRDPAHFCSYLLGRVGLDAMPKEQTRALAQDFAAEYFSRVPTSWRRRFSLHSAGALVEVACGIFRHQEPQWLDKATAAIAEARHALSAGTP